MSRYSVRRSIVVAASTLILGAAVAAPSPALAGGSMFFSKSSGTTASVTWLEVGDDADALPGNFHFGDLTVDKQGSGRAFAYGAVVDVQCEPGVEPHNPGGGHGPHATFEEPPSDTGCMVVGKRFMFGEDIAFAVNQKLSRATLTGRLGVHGGHGEGPVATPPVSITWTGVGGTYTERQSGSFTDEYGGRYSYRYTFTGRNATIAEGSRIGVMVFDDEDGEWSEARLGKYRQSDRGRS